MTEERRWDQKMLMLSHGLLGLAILSWFIPFTHQIWSWVDHNLFYTLNGTLDWHPTWTKFWAYANHRMERKWCPAVMGTTSVLWVLFGKQKNFFFRAAAMSFFWAYLEAWIPLMNGFVMKVLEIRRESPSLVLEPVFRLSEMVEFGPIRDASAISFVSGHSYVMSFWAGFMIFCTGFRSGYGRFALAVVTLNSLPRLFAGGHWLSDCLFAVLIAFMILSWAIATPLHLKAIGKLERLFERICSPVTRRLPVAQKV